MKKSNTMMYKTREQVADYFHVTRMTLYRWEKILPLPRTWDHPHVPIKPLEKLDLDNWFTLQRQKARNLIITQRSPM